MPKPALQSMESEFENISEYFVFGMATACSIRSLFICVPKFISRLAHPVVPYIQIFPLCLLILSFIYGAMRFIKK